SWSAAGLSSFVRIDTADNVTTVTLDRPEALNALSGAMAEELTATFRRVSEDSATWVMVLAAEGEKAFCVGADLKERAAFSLDDFYANRAQIRGLFDSLRSVPQPTVASVFGFTLGGGFELALSCDLIVAARGTRLGLPEARVGLLPAGGGTQLLTRKVGTSRAKDLIFRGKQIDAERAQQLGLVTEVCERDELRSHTLTVARDVCRSSPVATRAAKRAIDGSLGVPLPQAIELENEAWKDVISSDDRLEGIRAFNEKRDPRWQNR
ncbi:MAG TPA: enoyl-CoA hydratase-related protein, partial [Actinomycetota bacterium]|nr:enoyl-CoA hydratase-related protein [Actinomycetota bacterium]